MTDAQVRLLKWLLDERARVSGEVLEVHRDIWAIHGSIPVEGDVIMAEFAVREDATAVLDALGPNPEQPTPGPFPGSSEGPDARPWS
jgi:hypothetical protein